MMTTPLQKLKLFNNKFAVILLINFFGFLLGSNFCSAQENPTSSVMLNFQITQCHLDRCLKVRADKAFVSQSGDSLLAADTHCELIITAKESHTEKIEHYQCKSFHYDIRSQFLICDNRQDTTAGGRLSFTMDASLTMLAF
jgi:hypothetical protein